MDPDRATPYTDPCDDPIHWPLHQRLLGALVRAAAATLGLVPLALFLIVEVGLAWETSRWLIVGFVALACALAFERRDAPWWSVWLRLTIAGAVAAIVIPLTWVWLENLGDPVAAYADLGRRLRADRLFRFLSAALALGLLAGSCGLVAYVRSRTTRLWPPVAAGMLTLLGPIVGLLTVFSASGDAARPVPTPHDVAFGRVALAAGLVLVLTLTGAAVPLGLALGDRLAQRVDPKAPLPPGGRPLRPTFAVAGVLVFLTSFGSVIGAVGVGRRPIEPGGEAGAVAALRTLATAQSAFRENDLDGDGAFDCAANLTELWETGQIDDRLATGLRGGYVFRVVRSTANPESRWAAAADPIAGSSCRRHFVVNHAGTIFESPEAIALDPIHCELPAGLESW